MKARDIQLKRYGIRSRLNGDMSNKHLKSFAQLDPAVKEMLDLAAERLNISARSYMKTVKVARTIADLAQSAKIEREHIAESLQYRRHEQPLTALA